MSASGATKPRRISLWAALPLLAVLALAATILVLAAVQQSPGVAVMGRIVVGDEPLGIAASPDGRKVYVASAAAGTLSMVDVAAQRVERTVVIDTTARLSAVAVGESGQVYVASTVPAPDGATTSTVSVVDPAAGQVTARIAVGTFPLALATSPDGSTLYAVNTASNNISVIDLATQQVRRAISVGERPRGFALSSDGKLGYVAYGLTHGIGVVDLAAGQLLRTVELPRLTRLGEMALSADGSWLYAVDSSGNAVLAIDLVHGERLQPIALGRSTDFTEYSPIALALAPGGRRLFVANRDGSVSVLEVPENRLKGTLRQVGIDLRGVAFTSDGTAFVTSLGTDEVVVIK